MEIKQNESLILAERAQSEDIDAVRRCFVSAGDAVNFEKKVTGVTVCLAV